MAEGNSLVTPKTREAIQDLIRNARNMRGVGMTVTPSGVSIGPQRGRHEVRVEIREAFRVKVTEQLGHGKYEGYTLLSPTNDILSTGNLTSTELGPTNEPCLILSAMEVGNSGTNAKGIPISRQVYFNALFVQRRQSDGLLVVQIDQVSDDPC